MSEIDNLDLPRWMSIRRRALEKKLANETQNTIVIDDIRW